MSSVVHLTLVDRDIKLDAPQSFLHLQPGEELFDTINQVEDTKGNKDIGKITLTNLRLLWRASTYPLGTISIGYNCIKDMYIRESGTTNNKKHLSLYLRVALAQDKMEFVFSTTDIDCTRFFSTMQTLVRAYETSRTYHDIRVHGALIKDGELRVLKFEKVISNHLGVFHVSGSQRARGTLDITNVRYVWYSDEAATSNISIPLIFLDNASIHQLEGVPTLHLSTSEQVGGSVYAFQSESPSNLQTICVEMIHIHNAAAESPIYGLEYILEDVPQKSPAQALVPTPASFIDKSEYRVEDSFSKYIVDSSLQQDRPPVYSPSLGLAIESLPDSYTIETIWNDLLETAKIAMKMETLPG